MKKALYKKVFGGRLCGIKMDLNASYFLVGKRQTKKRMKRELAQYERRRGRRGSDK